MKTFFQVQNYERVQEQLLFFNEERVFPLSFFFFKKGKRIHDLLFLVKIHTIEKPKPKNISWKKIIKFKKSVGKAVAYDLR